MAVEIQCRQVPRSSFWRKNERYDYKLCNLPIKHVTEEKDLGVIISEDIKVYKNLAKNVKEANKICLAASKHVLAKYLLMTPRLQAKSTLVTKLISCKKI